MADGRANDRSPPKAALIAAGIVMAGSVIATALAPRPDTHPPDFSTAISVRDLRFVDAGDGMTAFGGQVRVYDATTGVELAPLRERDGFIRAALSGLAFERTKSRLDAPPVYTLAVWPGGRMTLEDRVTGRHINVGSFGAGNRDVFDRLIKTGAAS